MSNVSRSPGSPFRFPVTECLRNKIEVEINSRGDTQAGHVHSRFPRLETAVACRDHSRDITNPTNVVSGRYIVIPRQDQLTDRLCVIAIAAPGLILAP